MIETSDVVDSLEALHALYGEVVPTAVTKELDHISEHYRAFIDAAPFVVLATGGPEGLDCSPRGDPAGFVRIVNDRTIMMPDRRGNNRLDSLRNIVRDPRIALLFLIPGINETLRVNGTAVLSTNVALRESFAMGDKVPACVIVVTVGSVYSQCPKALVRSHLWDPAHHVDTAALPSAGQRLEALTCGEITATDYDAAYAKRFISQGRMASRCRRS
jgi:PPOX class probable FMN-dependent enzyme